MTDEIYSIGKFAKLVGKSIRTLQRWDKVGILTANRTATGRRFYTTGQYHQVVGTTPVPERENRKNIGYTRVSGNDQKKDLMSQRGALEQYIISNGIAIDEWLSDVGSGLNYKRKNFNYLLIEVESNRVGRIIIAHKDRLVRFGYEWFEEFCKRHNCEIVVINAESLSPEEEVTKDLLTIIHCFSSRLYGLRRYKKEIEKMVTGHEND
jgi:predicted site-specific integrase-resolvase